MAGYVYVKLDVDFQSDPKMMQAGHLAELVYVRSLALAKRTLLDGRIAQSHLTLLALGIPGKPSRHADALVTAGLWTVEGDGWRITSWAKHNKSKDDIEAQRKRKMANGTRGAHEKWHTDPSKANDSCVHCIANGWQTDSTLPSLSHTQTWPKTEEEEKEKEKTKEESSVAIVSSGSSSPESDPSDDDEQPINAVIEQLTQRRANEQTRRNNPPRTGKWWTTTRTNIATEHRTTISTLIAAHPHLEPCAIATLIEQGRTEPIDHTDPF